MNRSIVFWLLILLFSACNKDKDAPPDHTVNISGQMIDALTREPIQDWGIRAEKMQINKAWEYEYVTLDNSVTNSNGNFELAFYLEYDFLLSDVNLKLDSVPSGYQPGARINGKLCRGLVQEGVAMKEVFLKDNGVYLVELMPHTRAFMLKPVIPHGWETDTLELHVENLVKDPDWVLNSQYAYFQFRMNNQNQWQDLKKARYLNLGDQLDFTYTIRNGGVKKSGSFSVQCALGDITAIVLPLWE